MLEGHGDDTYNYKRPILVNFSSNVYRGMDLSGLQAHLSCCIREKEELLSSYPEPQPRTLETRLAEKFCLPPSSVCVTNGATEAIYLIARAYHGANTAILQPTFSEYADACRMNGHQITPLYRLADTKDLPGNIRMLWLCNPNNPTGEVHEKAMLTEMILKHPSVYFIIDQSYEDFTLASLYTPEEAAAFPNVFLLHSMTKSCAIPGLRLGYITGNENLINHLRTNRMPWSVNALAIEAGLYFLKNKLPICTTLESYLAEAHRLREALRNLGGMDVWHSETHFMLVRLRSGKASALKDYLANEYGLLIRDASNFEGLDDGFFRIATQLPADNECLVQAIEKWWRE